MSMPTKICLFASQSGAARTPFERGTKERKREGEISLHVWLADEANQELFITNSLFEQTGRTRSYHD